MKTIDRDTAKQYMYKTNGKIFSVVFTKKNGEKRLMGCRLGVSKYVKGVGLKFKPEEKSLIGVFDMVKRAYRFISLHTLEQLKINGHIYNVQTENNKQKESNNDYHVKR